MKRAFAMPVMRVTLPILMATVAVSGCAFWSQSDKRKPAELQPIEASVDVRQGWSASIGKMGRFTLQPVVAGGVVYASAAGGTVAAFEAASGRAIWQAKTDIDLTSGPGSDGKVTAVAGEKGVVYAFDASGRQLWKASVNGEVLSSPLVGNGMVIVRTTDTRIIGLDATTGERRWINQRTQSALNLRSAIGMTFAGEGIVTGFPGGKLGYLGLNNGSLRWETVVSYPKGVSEIERLNDVTGTPFVSGQEVCAVAFQGRVGCFDLSTGAPRWTRDFSSPTGLAAESGMLFASTERSVMTGMSQADGKEVWKNEALLWRNLGSPLAIGNVVIAGDYQGQVHFFARQSGKFVARMKTDGSAIASAPVLSGQTVIVQTKNGGLYAFVPN
jgi:outer membrane protein assembly factor BamB